MSANELVAQVTPEDLERFGMIPELVGRLPVISTLDQLSVEDLAKILTEPKDALLKQYQVLFPYDDARSNSLTANPRCPTRQGPRNRSKGLRSIMESIMLDIMYELPERQPGQTYTITEQVVRGEKSLFGPEGA